MADDTVEQECPFCSAPWGKCEHIEMLEGLEAEADENDVVETSEYAFSDSGKH